MNETLRRNLKLLHYPIELLRVCVRWYAARPPGVMVEYATIHQ
jgi:hypothetical protein